MLHMNVSIRTRLNFSEEMSAYLFKKEKSEEERKRKEVKERQNKTNKQKKNDYAQDRPRKISLLQ